MTPGTPSPKSGWRYPSRPGSIRDALILELPLYRDEVARRRRMTEQGAPLLVALHAGSPAFRLMDMVDALIVPSRLTSFLSLHSIGFRLTHWTVLGR